MIQKPLNYLFTWSYIIRKYIVDTFCVLPWYSHEIRRGSVTSCCLLPANHDIEQIKKDLLAGVLNPSCNKCWRLESAGVKSRRQQENEFLDYKLDRDISLIRQDAASGNQKSMLYQIVISNICNQACVTCNSEFSTKWAEIEKKQGSKPKKRWALREQDHKIDFQSARRINLLGGEPLFDSYTFEILQNLLDAGNHDCFISLVTNGSIEQTKAQTALLKNFTDLNICVSIDGIEKRFEYMRWPARWTTLLKNLDSYRSLCNSVSVSYTISSLNAIYYEETVSWFAEQNLNFNHNIVTHPSWLSLHRAPYLLANEIKHTALSTMIENVEQEDLDSYRLHISSQDQAKRINLVDYMPEVAKIIGYTL